MSLNPHLMVKTSSTAQKENLIFWKDYRVTVLDSRLFRVEKQDNGDFCDAATQAVWFRNMPKQNFKTVCTEEKLTVKTDGCTLILRKDIKNAEIILNGKRRQVSNRGNLLGTYRTLDRYNGDTVAWRYENGTEVWSGGDVGRKVPLECGVCSRTGVAVFDDSTTKILKPDGKLDYEKDRTGLDEYIFAYGSDYREAVKAIYMICGNVPLIPRFALGNWWSRYHDYSDREYLTLLNRFEEENVPFTVATVDMDWHYSNRQQIDEEFGVTAGGYEGEKYCGKAPNYGWTGYTWNRHLFPDYKDFLKQVAKKNLKITLNLHPASGVRYWDDAYEKMATAMGIDPKSKYAVPFDIENDAFLNNYFEILHKPYEREGVGFWWIDWQQGKKWGAHNVDPLWSLNHYHYLDNAKNHANPLILSRYAGIGSHRYPLGFSGDTAITWKTLKYLPYFTATASNAAYTWWSHDIGGHVFGEMDGELYLRFLQFGVFSPINRIHCCNMNTITKEPWVYGNGVGLIAEKWLRLRHAMIPFLYSLDYKNHTAGIPLCEPLYYEYPDEPEAYRQKEEYLFGGLLVALVTQRNAKDGYARVNAWLPEGNWTDIFTGDEYEVPAGCKNLTLYRQEESIPVFAKAGTIIPFSADKGNSVANPKRLTLEIYNGNGEFTLYEDDFEQNGKDAFFTEFKTSFKNGVQTVAVTSHGNASVIPEGRKIRLVFKNIKKGIPMVKANGEKAATEELYLDYAATEITFAPDTVYEISVVFDENRIEYLKQRAIFVLQGMEGNNEMKLTLGKRLSGVKSVEEYARVIADSDVQSIVKKRLTEVL